MPCNSGPTIEQQKEAEAKKKAEKQKAEKLEVLLCSACNVLEREGYNFSENPALDEWWHEHKKEDLKRKALEVQEQARKLQEIERAKEEIERAKMLIKKHYRTLTDKERLFLSNLSPDIEKEVFPEEK